MTYQQTLDFLFSCTASYQQIGKTAYKKDLTNSIALCNKLGNPQHQFKSIHIAGTNGKGSTSHILTSVLMQKGYKVGLYTSPHYLDFSERIRVNGHAIDQQSVVDFIGSMKESIEDIQPSFFELTVALAFWYFAQQHIDIAVIEVGLGGRLDSTNIIQPILSVITSIDLDHQDLLGNTLEQIATEKAGIIKENTPVVIGQLLPETENVFRQEADQCQAPIVFAEQICDVRASGKLVIQDGFRHIQLITAHHKEQIATSLLADYQLQNIRTAYVATTQLQDSIDISITDFAAGLQNLPKNCPIIGRFQVVSTSPITIVDSCHNEEGIRTFFKQISTFQPSHLHIIFGCVSDKEISSIQQYFPSGASIYLTQPSVSRKMPVETLATFFPNYRYKTEHVKDALTHCYKHAEPEDIIVIVGSIFLVADVLSSLNQID